VQVFPIGKNKEQIVKYLVSDRKCWPVFLVFEIFIQVRVCMIIILKQDLVSFVRIPVLISISQGTKTCSDRQLSSKSKHKTWWCWNNITRISRLSDRVLSRTSYNDKTSRAFTGSWHYLCVPCLRENPSYGHKTLMQKKRHKNLLTFSACRKLHIRIDKE